MAIIRRSTSNVAIIGLASYWRRRTPFRFRHRMKSMTSEEDIAAPIPVQKTANLNLSEIPRAFSIQTVLDLASGYLSFLLATHACMSWELKKGECAAPFLVRFHL